jgi:hypothetical protein
MIKLDIELDDPGILKSIFEIANSEESVEVVMIENSAFTFAGIDLINFVSVSVGSGVAFESFKMMIQHIFKTMKEHLKEVPKECKVTINGVTYYIKEEKDADNVLEAIIEEVENLKRDAN